MSYLDSIPRELLYIIISYLSDKYEIKNVTSIITFTENDWKNLLYHSVHNTEIKINNKHTWEDNYFDNTDERKIHNINIMSKHDVYDHVVIFGINIDNSDNIDNIKDVINDCIVRETGDDTDDQVAFIQTSTYKYIMKADGDHLKIISYINKKLKDKSIKSDYIGIYTPGLSRYNTERIVEDNIYVDQLYGGHALYDISLFIDDWCVLLINFPLKWNAEFF